MLMCVCVCVVVYHTHTQDNHTHTHTGLPVYLPGFEHMGSDKRVLHLRQGLPRQTGRELGPCCTCCRVGWGNTERKK